MPKISARRAPGHPQVRGSIEPQILKSLGETNPSVNRFLHLFAPRKRLILRFIEGLGLISVLESMACRILREPYEVAYSLDDIFRVSDRANRRY